MVFKEKILLVAVATTMLLSLALGGCAFSDTITQKIYDQERSNAVDPSVQKMLVNTLDAETVSDELPQLITDATGKDKQTTDQDLPRYGGDTSDALVAQPVTSPNEPAQELNVTPQAVTDAATDAEGNPKTGEEEGTTPEDGDGTGDGGDGLNPEEEGTNSDETGKGKNADNDVKVYQDYGEFPETPEGITHVTAVGQAAVIVSALGGTEDETPLVGADAAFVEDEQVQTVLAAKGVAGVEALWDNDGTQEGDLSKANLKKIIKSDVELCFTMEGDDTFTKEQEEALLEEDIIVYVLPSMASASRIVSAVKIVGDILEAGGNEEAGKLRDAYEKFHTGLVDALVDENGGITGGYNYNTGKKVSTKATDLYTLLITDWDDTASYADENAFLTSSQGVALAALGYEKTPVAHYLSVGGVINNAAAGSIWRNLSGRTAVVWQFTTSKASLAWRRWTSIDRTKVTYAPDVQGFDTALMWSATAQAGAGTAEFPGVVVATQAIKDRLLEDAARDNGLYHPYPVVSKGEFAVTSSVGFYTGGNLVDACIGTHGMGTKSTLNDGTATEYYDVHVNPAGLFSSWIDGSMESVLEAAWAYQTFRDDTYNLEEQVHSFYQEFYGYELSPAELDAILAGPEA